MKPDSSFLTCPRDGGEMMMMDRREITVSHCGGCRGIWIPKAHLVGRIEGNLIRKLYHAPASRMANLKCPVDGSPLWEFSAGGVLLDRCNSCGGLWFDAGEMETVMGKIQFTTSPSVALNRPYVETSWTDLLDSALRPTGADAVGELVVELVKWLASGLD